MQLRAPIRRLSYLLLPCTTVATVVYHLGWPSSAAEAGAWQQAAAKRGVQVFAVDRPGVAGSSFDPQGAVTPQHAAHLNATAQLHKPALLLPPPPAGSFASRVTAQCR